jgi:hypothetical protein
MSELANVRGINPFWIVGAYGVLLVILLGFFVLMALIYENAKFTPEWIPEASKTVLDMVKVVVGAIVGTLTPALVNAARGPHSSNK